MALSKIDVANMLTGEVPNANVADLAASKITSGTLAVARGGTGVSSGTSGQFLKFTGTTTLASAAVDTGGVLLAGSKTANGGIANGSGVDMLTSDSINLSSYQDKYLIVFGQTAISENSNTSNTAVLRIELSNGSTVVTLSASRQGMGAYGSYDGNRMTHISAFAVYQIPSAYATTCTIRLNGGINSGDFTYGDQSGYSFFDGEGAGIGMRFFVI